MAFCVLRGVRLLLFAPPPRRSFDDIGFHRRFQPLLCIYARSFFSRDDDDDDGKMMLSSDVQTVFSPLEEEKA
jgi:hypothetical protein|tara:strand:+ start:1620 stop:1838 length:219 start_codon:yes stop_codon:yes gene_type:complete